MTEQVKDNQPKKGNRIPTSWFLIAIIALSIWGMISADIRAEKLKERNREKDDRIRELEFQVWNYKQDKWTDSLIRANNIRIERVVDSLFGK